MKRTKIVATLGPSTNTVEMMVKLIKAGVNGARLNFSHGDYENHGKMIEMLDEARNITRKHIALILDTKGPEIRLKSFKDGKVHINTGDTFTLTTREVEGTQEIISITYKGLPEDLKLGNVVLLDDGLIELKVEEIKDTDIICKIINGGDLKNNKGVNVPNTKINLPSLTKKDEEDIIFGIGKDIDYVAASFIRNADDVRHIRELLDKNNGEEIKIISKIENKEGVKNLDSILDVSDGIMVARGDMGVEISPEQVPLVQKSIIQKCNKEGKLVITATQMLDSMMSHPRPTRAEANDVANAIFDGTDCVMLSGETAAGEYPLEAVEMMTRIAVTTEKAINYTQFIKNHDFTSTKTSITDAIAFAACTVAADIKAAGIAPATNSGFSARMVSKFRPHCPIVSLTASRKVARQLNLYWGISATYTTTFGSMEIMENKILEAMEDAGITEAGDTVVTVAGFPIGTAGTTNTIRVSVVGDVMVKGTSSKVDTVIKAKTSIIRDVSDISNFEEGNIVVLEHITDDIMPILEKAVAIVTGGRGDNYRAILDVGEELDIPVMICEEDVMKMIPEGITITIDSQKGIIYNGIREV